MSSNDEHDNECEGVFITGVEEDMPDVICQRALAMCKVAEVVYNLGEEDWSSEQVAELRSELLTMLKKLNTSVDLPTQVQRKKAKVLNLVEPS